MSATTLPTSPTVGQTSPLNGYDYVWDGKRWISSGLAPKSMSTSPIASQVITGSTGTVTPIILKALSGQTADLFKVEDDSAADKFQILKNGDMKVSGAASFTAGLSGTTATFTGALTGATATFSGAVTVPTTPTAAGEATSKQYVDTQVATALDQTEGDARYLQVTGGTVTGHITNATAPTSGSHLSNKTYTDAQVATATSKATAAQTKANSAYTLAGTKITQAQGDGRYFRKTGGTVSGSVTVTGNVNVNGYIHSKQDIWAFNSDRNIKAEFKDMPEDCLERNHLMKGMTFIRTDIEDDNNRRYAGIIAQDVGEAIPEGIEPDDKGVLRVDPNALFGHLINCINKLNNELEHCKFRLSMLEGGSDGTTN